MEPRRPVTFVTGEIWSSEKYWTRPSQLCVTGVCKMWRVFSVAEMGSTCSHVTPKSCIATWQNLLPTCGWTLFGIFCEWILKRENSKYTCRRNMNRKLNLDISRTTHFCYHDINWQPPIIWLDWSLKWVHLTIWII